MAEQREWLDRFTGWSYRLIEEQYPEIRQTLAGELAQRITANAHEAANAVAQFWFEDYYERVFPLRFGREPIDENQPFYKQGKELEYGANGAIPANAAWRKEFLHDLNYPPLLPAETQPDPSRPSLLIADHHLATAALLNVCLRSSGVETELVHQVRLGALLHELSDLPTIQEKLRQHPEAFALAQYLNEKSSSLPDALQPYQQLIDSIHLGNANNAPDVKFCLVGLAAQRIKQYVYETPGLPEIRGASQLLDEVVQEMAKAVAQEIGRECVLQTAASTLNFLAPEPSDWTTRLKRAFYEKTLVGFCAAAAHPVGLKDFLSNYSQCVRGFLTAIDADRYRAELPVWECLPFEARCVFCKRRAGVQLVQPSPGADLAPICQPCARKRDAGNAEARRELGLLPLQDAGILPRQGARGKLQELFERYFASEKENRELWYRAFTGGLNELVPETDEREGKKQVAFIYGDGSNFGQITKNLDSLAMSLQWTRRAELVNRAAIALALSRCMQEAIQEGVKLQRMPYEVLVVGGDDFSLFTWSRLALRFCQQFLELTDLEYAKGDPNQCIVRDTPICYGIGCLITDEKAPAQRVVEFTEQNLLKFAKRGVKAHGRGALAFLFTTNADQIPSDYADHLRRNYCKEARLGKGGSDKTSVYLTMQPLTACETDAFLKCAEQLKRDMGGLQRLAEPFVRQPIEAALLHFVYQRARAESDSQRKEFYDRIMALQASDGNGTRVDLFPIRRLKRINIDHDQPTQDYFAPILDLLEITKSLR